MRKLIFAFFLITNISTSNAENSSGINSFEEESMVVFMRSSFVGAAVKASIYEIRDGETIFIGIMKNKTKINYKTSAGKHTFMVVSEAADFMDAELEEGKTYYSMITSRAGAWKTRFSMKPIRNDGTTDLNTESKKFEKWKKKTKVVLMDEKSKTWYEEHKESVEEKRAEYWGKWIQKSAEDKLERTLKVSDGT